MGELRRSVKPYHHDGWHEPARPAGAPRETRRKLGTGYSFRLTGVPAHPTGVPPFSAICGPQSRPQAEGEMSILSPIPPIPETQVPANVTICLA